MDINCLSKKHFDSLIKIFGKDEKFIEIEKGKPSICDEVECDA